MSLIIQLILGAVGGNIGGAIFKNLSLGTLGNSIAGIIGGGIGGHILQALLGTGAEGSILGDVAGGGVGGIIVMAVVGMIRKAMGKKGGGQA